jgi:hypothetical protein
MHIWRSGTMTMCIKGLGRHCNISRGEKHHRDHVIQALKLAYNGIIEFSGLCLHSALRTPNLPYPVLIIRLSL